MVAVMQIIKQFLLATLLYLCAPPLVFADHPTDLDHLLRQVKQAHVREAAIRKEREQRFLAENADRKALLEELRGRVEQQRERGQTLKAKFEANEKALQTLQAKLDARVGNLGELFGTVRQSANDMHALLKDSLVSAEFPGRANWFDQVAKNKKLPNVTELERFWLLMQQEIEQSGHISHFEVQVAEVMEKAIIASARTAQTNVQIIAQVVCALVFFREDHRVNARVEVTHCFVLFFGRNHLYHS